MMKLEFKSIMDGETNIYEVTSIDKRYGVIYLYQGEECIKTLDAFYYKVKIAK